MNSATTSAHRRIPTKVIAAVSIGNIVEWFDFAVYAFVATNIAANFFPSADPRTGLLATFAVFATALMLRPIGGFIFAPLGDRVGRRKALSLVVILMAIATFAVGILPSYAQWGFLSPALLVLARSLQAMSAGGELGGAASFLAEYAHPYRRATIISIVPATTFGGILVASLFMLGLRSGLSAEQFDAWGWRIPFLIALPIGVIGLYIRLKLDDTPEFKRLEAEGRVSQSPLKESFVKDYKSILISMGLVMVIAVTSYTLTSYLPTYLRTEIGFTPTQSLYVSTWVLIVMVVTLPICGYISDYIGRRASIIFGCAALALLAYPMFLLMSSGSFAAAMTGGGVLAAALSFVQCGVVPMMTELFVAERRYSGFSSGWNLSISVFGGSAPYLATYLIGVTASKLAPSWMMTAAAVLSLLVAVMAAPETAARLLDKRRAKQANDPEALAAKPAAVGEYRL